MIQNIFENKIRNYEVKYLIIEKKKFIVMRKISFYCGIILYYFFIFKKLYISS